MEVFFRLTEPEADENLCRSVYSLLQSKIRSKITPGPVRPMRFNGRDENGESVCGLFTPKNVFTGNDGSVIVYGETNSSRPEKKYAVVYAKYGRVVGAIGRQEYTRGMLRTLELQLQHWFEATATAGLVEADQD